MTTLSERLRSWAQNEEMVDARFTGHGQDCIASAAIIDATGVLLRAMLEFPANGTPLHPGALIWDEVRDVVVRLEEKAAP